MKFASILLILITKFTIAGILHRRDTTISQSYRDATDHANFGFSHTVTNLNQGVTAWLSGLHPHHVLGNVNIYGQLILSQTDYVAQHSFVGGMDADYLGSNTQDGNLFIAPGGQISLNDYGTDTGAHYLWHLYTFKNNGSLQFCGFGNHGSGSDYSLHCEIDCYNYGVIDWAQYEGYNSDLSVEWENDNKQGPGQSSYHYVYNYGAFRLTNTTFHGRQNIYGDGCWVLGNHGTLYLEDGAGYYQNPSSGPTYPGQRIYFSATNSFLHLDSGTYTTNPNFGPQLYNFGIGNAIEFEETIQSYSYDTTTGILTVSLSASNHPIYIKLGTGYTTSRFYTARNPQPYSSSGYMAIFYSGAAPAVVIPDKCQVTVGQCGDPALTAGPFASTTTITTLTTSQPSTTASGLNDPDTSDSTTSNPTSSRTSTEIIASSPTISIEPTSIPTITSNPTSTLATSTEDDDDDDATDTAVTLPSATRPAMIATTLGSNTCVCRPR